MLALLAGFLAMAAPAHPVQPTPCRPRDLAIVLDDRDGDFNGMSHSGTRLTIRSKARGRCLLAGLPTVSFRDAAGQLLPVERKAPPGMHPGPMIVPVRLEPGASAHADLRWVSGDVYDNGRCLKPAQAVVTVGGIPTKLPFTATICGESGKPATFEQPPLSR